MILNSNPRIGARWLVATALAVAATAAATGAEAAPIAYPITHITAPTSQPIMRFEVADGEQYALVSHGNGVERLTLADGSLSPIRLGGPFGADELSDDGHYAFVADFGSTSFRRIEVGSMAEIVYTPLPAGWGNLEIVASDAIGRFVLLQASNGMSLLSRAFVFDTQGQTLVTPDGLSGPDPQRNSRGLDLSADGQTVTFGVYEVLAPGGHDAVVRWNRTNDQRTSLRAPPNTV